MTPNTKFSELPYGALFRFKNADTGAVYRKTSKGKAILNSGVSHEEFKCSGNCHVERT
ncbi:hypothetical protein Psp6_00010 [Pseudomonas phage Psp6]|nr:hypothetical protein Psp6_00010 [Pseudomonas phage Psp6]